MLGALDLLRRLGWSIIDMIYSLIDTLFSILKELNLYDIIDSVSENTVFFKFSLRHICNSYNFVSIICYMEIYNEDT